MGSGNIGGDRMSYGWSFGQLIYMALDGLLAVWLDMPRTIALNGRIRQCLFSWSAYPLFTFLRGYIKASYLLSLEGYMLNKMATRFLKARLIILD